MQFGVLLTLLVVHEWLRVTNFDFDKYLQPHPAEAIHILGSVASKTHGLVRISQ